MSPLPRKESSSRYYHVVQKGNANQVIFLSDKDRKYYVRTLEDVLHKHELNLHAYCLMDNHTHLIMEGDLEKLSAGMRQLGQGYAFHFREVTGQVGHVFSGRFWSEPIETDEYLLCAVRYVHCNPEPPRLARASEYPWSSYQSYVSGNPGFVTTDTVREMFGNVASFERFHSPASMTATPFPGSKLYGHLTDEELFNIASDLLDGMSPLEVKGMKNNLRKQPIQRLFEAGYSVNQISRITGLGTTQIQRLRPRVHG